MLWIGYTSIIRPIVYFRSSRKWKRGFGAEMKNCSTWNWHNKIIYASNTTFILLLTCWLLRKNQSTVPRYGSINSQNKSARQYPAYRAISNPLIVFVFSGPSISGVCLSDGFVIPRSAWQPGPSPCTHEKRSAGENNALWQHRSTQV